MAQVIVEVNLCEPLVEKISCLDKNGGKLMIDVGYPWLPPRYNLCAVWGHKGDNYSSKNIQILQKEKEILGGSGNYEVALNGMGKVSYELDNNRNVVNDLLLGLRDYLQHLVVMQLGMYLNGTCLEIL